MTNNRHNLAQDGLTRHTGVPYARTMEELAQALKRARGRRDLSQSAAAKQAGVSLRQWSRYENETVKIYETSLDKLERWLAKEG